MKKIFLLGRLNVSEDPDFGAMLLKLGTLAPDIVVLPSPDWQSAMIEQWCRKNGTTVVRCYGMDPHAFLSLLLSGDWSLVG